MWQRINQQGVYGYMQQRGDYTLEVIRAYTNDWRCFLLKNGELQRGTEVACNTLSQAKKAARVEYDAAMRFESSAFATFGGSQ